jgi:ABC-type Zn uptake system ZnuABC Zn-binding protein ZnuA
MVEAGLSVQPSLAGVRAALLVMGGALIICCALLFAGSSGAQERLRIVTTTTDLRSLAEAVGGDRVAVTSLVPPSFDPEEYQPKPQDMARLKDVGLVVRVGLDFDLWFDRLLTQASLTEPKLREMRRGGPAHVDASAAIAVLDIRGASVGPSDGHAHGSGNPHYWLDPKNAAIITGNILEALARRDPEHAAVYETNRLAFLDRLAIKLSQWEHKVVPLHGRAMVAYHNSWAYFARRFRLNIVDVIEPRPGVPPSPAHLAKLMRSMREQNVGIILRQPLEPEKDAAFLARGTGAKLVLLAGSVGVLPSAPDYFSLFDSNIDALLAAAP